MDRKATRIIIISLAISAIGAAAKSYIDVEKLKVSYTNLFDIVKETRNDVRDVKKYLLEHRRER